MNEISSTQQPRRRCASKLEVAGVGVVGCGSVVETYHLPALHNHPKANVTWLCDASPERVTWLGQAWGIASVFTDVQQVPGADVVIIATPPASHASLTAHFLERGSHVLCEKPMATNLADAEHMVNAASKSGRKLAIGMMRRFYPATMQARRLVESGLLGQISFIEAEEGAAVRGGSVGSTFITSLSAAGGGVLLDTGSHLLDQLFYIVAANSADLISYRDNSFGGPESDCALTFSITTDDARFPVRMELSRTRALRQRIVIAGSEGEAEVATGHNGTVRLRLRRAQHEAAAGGDDAPWAMSLVVETGPSSQLQSIYTYFAEEITDLVESAACGREPRASGASVLPSLRLIEEAYRAREPLDEPWVSHLCNTARRLRAAETA